MTTRAIGIAPLSVLGTEPVDFISAAARAGCDFIGLRTRPVTATEQDLNLLHGNRRIKEVLAALKDTGMSVRDTEFLAIDPQLEADTWLPMLEAAVTLGAQTLTATITDTDLSRGSDKLAKIVEDGKQAGIIITLEPISYQTVQSLTQGAEVAKQTGCQVLFDTLHFHRAFGKMEEIPAALPYLANMVQLCDGISTERADSRDGLIEESRAKRYVPGEGDFKLAECLALLPPDMPVSVEVPNPKFAQMGLDGYIAHLMEAAKKVVAQSEQLRNRNANV